VTHGRAADTPVALIRSGTTEAQQTVTGTLADIADKAHAAGLQPPVVAVIGEVVALRSRLRWFEPPAGGLGVESATRAAGDPGEAVLSASLTRR